jgi:hypothetical protein
MYDHAHLYPPPPFFFLVPSLFHFRRKWYDFENGHPGRERLLHSAHVRICEREAGWGGGGACKRLDGLMMLFSHHLRAPGDRETPNACQRELCCERFVGDGRIGGGGHDHDQWNCRKNSWTRQRRPNECVGIFLDWSPVVKRAVMPYSYIRKMERLIWY